jgi:hypothetical protein
MELIASEVFQVGFDQDMSERGMGIDLALSS